MASICKGGNHLQGTAGGEENEGKSGTSPIGHASGSGNTRRKKNIKPVNKQNKRV